MSYKVFKESITGYKNIIKNNDSQDYVDYKYINNGIICALADGHSTDYFTYSNIGAKLACQVTINILEQYSKDINKLEDKLKDFSIQKLICDKWGELVEKHYNTVRPIVYRTEALKYSTTLMAVMVTEDYKLYLKIGDGGILEKSLNGYKPILDENRKYIVDSLGREDSYTNIIYELGLRSKKERDDKWVILFSDGYENSFTSKEDLYKSLDTTMVQINKNIFSKTYLNNHYKNYLSKLSKEQSHDDISIIFMEIN